MLRLIEGEGAGDAGNIQLLQYHLWEKVSFHHCITFASLPKIGWADACGPISGLR